MTALCKHHTPPAHRGLERINEYAANPGSWSQMVLRRSRAGEKVAPRVLWLARAVEQLPDPKEHWMTTKWIADQLQRMGAARPHAPQIPRFNPRPAGLIRPGCASEIVLAVLVRRSPVFLTLSQILQQSLCTKSAADWALRYLESQGHVESTSDEERNPRYRRYRVTEKGKIYASSRT